MSDKTHYRKVFDSPYLSSADIVEPVVLTIAKVTQEIDKTKKTKDVFNTAYFAEKEIRPGEKLKPMILNATNSKTMCKLAGTPFIQEWANISVTVYVDNNVRFGKEVMDGLRINTRAPARKQLFPEMTKAWSNAKAAFKRDGSLDQILAKMEMSEDHQAQLIAECETVSQEPAEVIEQ